MNSRGVRGNDWQALHPPSLGSWQPQRSVSVVIPAYQASATLPLTLAALSEQSYPAHLLEVVVVDDGEGPGPVLPELRPDNTRVVRTEHSWGRAAACRVGALAADGDIVHWLDADMLPHREAVEAQLRWHHLVDYAVVLGNKLFVDTGGKLPEAEEVARLVADGRAAHLFEGRPTTSHTWVDEQIARTDGLTKNPTMSFLVHVGSTASVARDLYLAAGGMDPTLKLGEDVELGYRLAQQGALFVPDAAAVAWHLGRSTLMDREEAVNRYNRPFVTDRVPSLRHWRTKGRSYAVPWVQAVVEADGASYDQVTFSVERVLTGSLHDVELLVVGPWSRLTDDRRSPLSDPLRELRMMHGALAGDPRVRFVEEPASSAAPATFRLRLPAGWAPGVDTVRRLAAEMTRRDRGLVSLLLPDGQVCRLERTSAFNRAARLCAGRTDVDLDAVVDEVSETWWYEGAEEGFTRLSDAETQGEPESSSSSPVPVVPPRGKARSRGAGSREALAGDPGQGTVERAQRRRFLHRPGRQRG